MSQSNVSVVIVNYNGDKVLDLCIQSCVNENISTSDIVVIDNGSSDSSESVCDKYPAIIFLRNRCNTGFARAVNRGLMACNKKFVLILNNDAQLHSGSIGHLLACAEQYPQAAFVGARLTDAYGRYQNVAAEFPRWWMEMIPRFALRYWRLDPKMTFVDKPICIPSFVGAAFLVRTAILSDLGMLDEEFFFYLEETEWCYRAHQKGYSVVFCPQAVVEHQLGGTANRYRGSARIEFHRSRLRYARKVEGFIPYLFVSFALSCSSFVNLIVNVSFAASTMFLMKKIRAKAAMYLVVFLWHVLGRPRRWGLPGKCEDIDRG